MISPWKKHIIVENDVIRTIGESSIGVLEWWDGSVTRLSGNSLLRVRENFIAPGREKLKISFQLDAGKSWSQVTSYIGKDSYFIQSFDDIEAWVRGTTFDVDVDNNLLHVTEHMVEILWQNGERYLIPEGKAFSVKALHFIDYAMYLEKFQDSVWTDLNILADQENLKKLQERLQDALAFDTHNPFIKYMSSSHRILDKLEKSQDFADIETYISQLSPNKRAELYTAMMQKYQNLNFVAPWTENYSQKMQYKTFLMLLSDDEEEKQNLLQNTLYDLTEILEKGQQWWDLEMSFAFFQTHVWLLEDFDTQFLTEKLSSLSWDFLSSQKTNLETLFWDISTLNFGIPRDIDDVREWVENTFQKADDFIQKSLDNSLWNLLE